MYAKLFIIPERKREKKKPNHVHEELYCVYMQQSRVV